MILRVCEQKYMFRFLGNFMSKPVSRRFLVILPALLGAFALAASAQVISPTPACAKVQKTIVYPPQKSQYPLASDKYSVDYKLGDGEWTPAMVYISNYGGSNSSPYAPFSKYPQGATSMSFVSIPAHKNAVVTLRVRNLGVKGGFTVDDDVTVRPSAKAVDMPVLQSDGRILVTRKTGSDFAGEQLILYWNDHQDAVNNGGIQGLVFFLNPPYTAPTTGIIKVVTGSINPTDSLKGYDTLDFEGTVAIGNGGSALPVPANITTIFLGPTAWVEGKLLFSKEGGVKVYGPGVLDVSRFEYDLRHCGAGTDFEEQGYPALNSVDQKTNDRLPLEKLNLDGIIISDNNFYATGALTDSTVNNVKIIAWNANNDGLQFGDNTTASNVFVRSGDDSLKMWGTADTVTNATVWQNYNGGVVNLGWYLNSPGTNGLIDGLYVVKTDWFAPKHTSWQSITKKPVNHQNNAVIASMMVPGTEFGDDFPSTYQNIFLDDAPQVLFSLKIVPPRPKSANANKVNLNALSNLDLKIQNVFTPPSVTNNSIGYDIRPNGVTLQGNMNITLTNLYIVEGTNATLVTAANAGTPLGKIITNGDNVRVSYNPVKVPPPPIPCKQFTCM